MAKKSKSQRARASARRAERKKAAEQADAATVDSTSVDSASASKEEKKGLFKRSSKKDEKQKPVQNQAPAKKAEKKSSKPAKKDGFFAQVRAEMKRVTWPTRQDVLRWSGVVVGALIFFGVYVFILDNWIVTPLLVAISSLGA